MVWTLDIVRELDRMQRDLESMFDRVGFTREIARFPLVNIYDNPDSVIVVAEAPGIKRENLNLSLHEGNLVITGKREPVELGENVTVLRSECCVGEFEKNVKIGIKVQEDQINASLKNGILTVTIPKAEEAKPRQIEIQS